MSKLGEDLVFLVADGTAVILDGVYQLDAVKRAFGDYHRARALALKASKRVLASLLRQGTDADTCAVYRSLIAATTPEWSASESTCRRHTSASQSGQEFWRMIVGLHPWRSTPPLGERSSTPVVSKIRALLPLGTLMTVVDVILSRTLHSVCDARATPSSFWECAVTGSSRWASHLAHAARLLIEKGLDSESTFALLQADIATFYDRIDVVRAAQVAVADGLRQEDVAAVIRHQLESSVSFRVSGATAQLLMQRTTGALTGSRTAGALGSTLR